MADTALKYDPLDTEKAEIRLVSLLESSPSVVECHLEHASLSAQPAYKALSYCWGDPNETKEIIVNGCITKVTSNLENALRRLRVRELGTFLWIDALCINQADLEERDHQVLRMRDIYSKATSVIAWIGEEDGSTAAAIAFLQRAAYGDKNMDWDMWEQCQESILGRPYWRRTWIVQEICLAKDVHIVTGSRAFSWEVLRKAVQRTTASYRHSDRDAYAKEAIVQLVNIRRSLETGCELKLLDVLNQTVLLKATDIRDKMYGLLGLTQDGPSVIPSPNYGLAVNAVVMSAMRAIAASETTLDVLAAKMPFEEPRQDSPSWYPAWEHYLWETKGSTIWHKTCQKAGQIRARNRPSFPFEVAQDMVITYGLELDMIFHSAYPRQRRYTSPEAVFAALDCLDSYISTTDFDSSSRRKHLMAVFASNQAFTPSGAPRTMLNSTSIDFLRANPGLAVSGWTLKDWVLFYYSRDKKELPKPSELENEHSKDYFSDINPSTGLSTQINQRLTMTRDGRLGLVHPSTQGGDKICILHAFHNIVILRPWGQGYKIVGYAYIDGLLDGDIDSLLERDNLECFRIL